MPSLPRSGRGIYAALVLLVAVGLAIAATTLGGAVLVLVAVLAIGYALYALFYRADQRVRGERRSRGGER